MLADALSVGHHSGHSKTLWDCPPAVTSVLIQGYDNWGLVLLCVNVLWICIDFLKSIMVYYAAPNCHKDSRSNSIENGLHQDWHHHSVPSGKYTNQLPNQLSWGAKFKSLLNVNLNNFIIEHTTETKILLLVHLDHRNIFQAHWANLKSPDLAFKFTYMYQIVLLEEIPSTECQAGWPLAFPSISC
jgi:hypothetical protein